MNKKDKVKIESESKNKNDFFKMERWERQIKVIKEHYFHVPFCHNCNILMIWIASNLTGYIYQCNVCKKTITVDYPYKFIVDKNGLKQVVPKNDNSSR